MILAAPGSGESRHVGRAHPEVECLAGPLVRVRGDAGLQVNEAQVGGLQQREHVPPHEPAAAALGARASPLAAPLHRATQPAHPLQRENVSTRISQQGGAAHPFHRVCSDPPSHCPERLPKGHQPWGLNFWSTMFMNKVVVSLRGQAMSRSLHSFRLRTCENSWSLAAVMASSTSRPSMQSPVTSTRLKACGWEVAMATATSSGETSPDPCRGGRSSEVAAPGLKDLAGVVLTCRNRHSQQQLGAGELPGPATEFTPGKDNSGVGCHRVATSRKGFQRGACHKCGIGAKPLAQMMTMSTHVGYQRVSIVYKTACH